MANEPSHGLRVWIDAQLPPIMTRWLSTEPGVEAQHTFTLGLLGASDRQIWEAARLAGAVVVSKDADFVALVQRYGPPPQIVWVTAGNSTNAALRELVHATWPHTVTLLRAGEALVELQSREL